MASHRTKFLIPLNALTGPPPCSRFNMVVEVSYPGPGLARAMAARSNFHNMKPIISDTLGWFRVCVPSSILASAVDAAVRDLRDKMLDFILISITYISLFLGFWVIIRQTRQTRTPISYLGGSARTYDAWTASESLLVESVTRRLGIRQGTLGYLEDTYLSPKSPSLKAPEMI